MSAIKTGIDHYSREIKSSSWGDKACESGIHTPGGGGGNGKYRDLTTEQLKGDQCIIFQW